jgi:hypothetical protein
MQRKDYLLMIGAVASGMQAVSLKSSDPRLTMFFTFLGVSLAFLAQTPRNPDSKDRISDIRGGDGQKETG